FVAPRLLLLLPIPPPTISTLFPYTTLFRSNSEIPKYVLSIISKVPGTNTSAPVGPSSVWNLPDGTIRVARYATIIMITKMTYIRSEEHTSELQSRFDLVCRLLLEKKNNKQN